MRQSKDNALSKQTRVAISCSTLEVVAESRIRAGKPVSASGPICLDSSDRLPNQERTSISTMSLPDRLRKQRLNEPLLDSNEHHRHDDGTELSSRLGQRS